VRTRATLRTVGERCGLHTSTVSRALRRPADADPTAARVHAAARELGYGPDLLAAGLRTSRSMVVGMLVHALTDVVQAILVEEVEDELAAHGYQLLVVNTHDRPDLQRAKVELMRSRRVDALVVADAHVDGVYADAVSALGIPYVLVGRRAGAHAAVTGDDERGGVLAAEHLAELGHRHIALVEGPPTSSASAGRAAGFADELARRGLHVHARESCPLFTAAGHEATRRLLRRARAITALFVAGDMAALGAIGALREAGLRPGHDISVVGYGDLTVAAPFGLTTIRAHQQEMGRRAARELLRALDGEPPRTIVLAPELVVRETTAPPRGDHELERS
jgi:LacI family transcriptional regulator